MTAEEAMNDALARHPDCTYADWQNGLAFPFTPTYVVQLWRNEECHAAEDPPKYTVEGYVKDAVLADVAPRSRVK